MTKRRRRNRNNKRNRNYGKRRRNQKTFKIYQYKIKTAIVSYVTPTYTEKNLKFVLYDLLTSTQSFQQLSPQYQQYKLERCTFIGMPRVVQGTDPAPVWIYLDTFQNDQFNYSAMEELQGARRLPVKRTSRTTFSNSGRQNDFHYWYDIWTGGADIGDMALRLHSEATPTLDKFWQFQIEFDVKFRGFTVKYEDLKEEKERTIRAISGRSGANELSLETEDPGEEQLNDINSNNDNIVNNI